MNVEVLRNTLAGSIAGTHAFPDVVRALMTEGVESYRADLVRMEATYYFPDGSTHVEKIGLPGGAVGESFSSSEVAAAIRGAQGGTVKYPEFVRRVMAAGTTNYAVYVQGRKVIYFGRNGELHIEDFPSAKA